MDTAASSPFVLTSVNVTVLEDPASRMRLLGLGEIVKPPLAGFLKPKKEKLCGIKAKVVVSSPAAAIPARRTARIGLLRCKTHYRLFLNSAE